MNDPIANVAILATTTKDTTFLNFAVRTNFFFLDSRSSFSGVRSHHFRKIHTENTPTTTIRIDSPNIDPTSEAMKNHTQILPTLLPDQNGRP